MAKTTVLFFTETPIRRISETAASKQVSVANFDPNNGPGENVAPRYSMETDSGREFRPQKMGSKIIPRRNIQLKQIPDTIPNPENGAEKITPLQYSMKADSGRKF